MSTPKKIAVAESLARTKTNSKTKTKTKTNSVDTAEMAETADVAPLVLQAARVQLDLMMSRLNARGFDDFTSAFVTVMAHLGTEGTRSTVLAQQAAVSKQAMSKLVRLMEARGYLEQQPDATDTRAKVIRPTKRGVEVKKACARVKAEVNRAIADALGATEAEEFRRCLALLVDRFSAAAVS